MTDVYPLGAIVPLTFLTIDPDTGINENATSASLTITRPDSSTVTPTLSNPSPGEYIHDYTTVAVGRYVAVFAASGTNAGVTVKVFDVIGLNLSVVTLADVKAYLGDSSWADAEITKALDAERIAQAQVCRIDSYGPDLREALLRRVSRNLAARAVPLTTFNTFEGGAASVRVPLRDAEVMRLEAPYRKLVMG